MTTIPTFTVGKYDGPETFACKMTHVTFSDGKNHFICTNDDVPSDYWPKDVYQINDSGEYGVIGTYKLNAGKYEFTPKKGGGSKSKRYRRKSKSHRKCHGKSHKKSRKH